MEAPFRKTFITLSLVTLAACSPKRMAVNVVGNALASGSGGWSREDDPQLVRDATPFALKTIESLLESSPKNRGLLTAAASGFTSYAYAFVESDADYIEATDHTKAKEMRARAKKLYLRGRDYGLRGLELKNPGLRAALLKDPAGALAKTTKADVPLLYWTAASWAAAIALDKTDAQLAADLPVSAAMMKRVLALDEGYGEGGAYDFFISYDASLPESAGGSVVRAKQDLDRAMALCHGKRAAPLVAFAEAASVAKQDKKEFQAILQQALAIDPNADPDNRLPNILSQQRARWLLTRMDDLFVE
ncbi:MAG TPA: TRAP transporter TatT component family protein [bacterium]|nr:TRAP transporter TatT component family protein [bacterium]